MEYYHGSPTHGIEKFTLDEKHRRHEAPHEGEGIYLTEDFEIAKHYAGSEGAVYTCKLASSPVFDATDPEEFTRCLRLAREEAGEVDVTPETAKMIRQTIQRIMKGDWGVTNFGEQVRQMLLNDELAVTMEDGDTRIAKTKEVINAYMDEHPVVKYYDSQIGNGKKLILVVRDPSLVKITSETPVQDLDYLRMVQ